MNPRMMMLFKQFMNDPRQFMARMGIPADQIQTPNQAIEWLMRNGKVTQQQYNRAAQMAKEMEGTIK